MVDLPVPVFGLADAAVGKRVAGMIRIHAEVEVVAGVSHGQLEERKEGGQQTGVISHFSTPGP